MPVPSCECVKGLTLSEKLAAIYCAALEVSIPCTTPELLSAIINGPTLTLVFSENVSGFVAGANGFSILLEGDPGSLNYVSGDGTDTVIMTSVPAAGPGASVFVGYIPGDIANRECPLEAITAFPVTNATFTYLQPDGVSNYFQPDGVSLYLQP